MIPVCVYTPDELCKNYKINRASIETTILRGILNKQSTNLSIDTKHDIIRLNYLKKKNLLIVTYVLDKHYPPEIYRIHPAYRTNDIRFEKLYFRKLIDKIEFISGYDVCKYVRNFQSIMQTVINNKFLSKNQNNTNRYFTLTFEGFSKCFRFVCKKDYSDRMEIAVYEADDVEYLHEIALYNVVWKVNNIETQPDIKDVKNEGTNKEDKLNQILLTLKSIDKTITQYCYSK